MADKVWPYDSSSTHSHLHFYDVHNDDKYNHKTNKKRQCRSPKSSPYSKKSCKNRDNERDGYYRNDRDHHNDRNDRIDRKNRRKQDRTDRSSRKELNHKEEIHEEEQDDEDYQERIEKHLDAQEENNVKKMMEESRRRRKAILDKYKQQKQEKEEQQQPKVGVDKALIVDNSLITKIDVKIINDLNENSVNETTSTLGHGSVSDKLEHSSDIFCDDVFVESPIEGWRLGRGNGLVPNSSGLSDNWDDLEGHYRFCLGEILNGCYHILASLGSGVFSTVVKAYDAKASKDDPNEVAIKIIRNNDTMYKSGLDEVVILRKLGGADVENKRRCVRLLSSFEYRNHLCLVFECLHMNLRNVLNKYGRNIGINLTAVQACTKQIFIALKHLQNCGVLHCDIKLDNILVNDSIDVRKLRLKLCDFGSAMFVGKNEITPYLVSRYYRAPEIILGLPYNHALDVWSAGCCLYELYSGKPLFHGHTNNEMLRYHMDLMGAFPKKMLKKAQFKEHHFDQDLNFCAMEEDPVTKKMVKKIIKNDHFIKPKGMRHLIINSGIADEESRLATQFSDLLAKMLVLDPNKRITIAEALNHPFILKRGNCANQSK